MPPTFETFPVFERDLARLDPEQQRRFRAAARHFVEDLDRGQFRPDLRVKRVQGTSAVWEMTFSPDGRSTWQYGDEVRPGDSRPVRISGQSTVRGRCAPGPWCLVTWNR